MQLFLYILLSLQLSYFIPISSMYNSAVEELYEKIKTLDPDQPLNDYEFYHQKLKENNSNITSCVHRLIENDKRAAYNALKLEFNVNPEGFQNDPLFKEWRRQSTLNNNIIFDQSLNNAHETKNLLKKLIDENNIKAPICVKFDSNESLAKVERSWTTRPNLEFNELILGPGFFELDILQQRGVLLHELEHIVKMHGGYKFLAFIEAKEANPTFIPDQFNSSSSYKQLLTTFEAEADRMPACKSIQNAQAIESFFKRILDQKNSGEYAILSDPNDYHPPLQERYNWATRILKFKQIEYNMFQAESNQFTKLAQKLLRHLIVK